MSYNQGPNGWDSWFSDLDLSALKRIWSIENDNGILSFTKKVTNINLRK